MSLSGKGYRVAVIASGVLSVGLVIWATVEHRSVTSTDDLTADVRKRISMAQDQLAHITDPSLLKQVSAPADRFEEASFLTFLQGAKLSAHVQVVRLQTSAASDDMMAMVAKTPEDKALLTGISPMAATIELQGNYPSLLRFTNRFLSAPRLYNLNNLAWTRGKSPDDTHLQLFLVRYVGQGNDGLAPTPPDAGGQVPKA